MIGIIVALEKEVCSLLRKSEIIKEKTIAGKKFITCKLEDKNAVIAISNVGKVASAMTCQSLIDNFAPETILNFGSVGGIKEKAKPLSIYAVEKCCQYDFDLSQIDNCPVAFNQNYNDVYIELKSDILNLKKINLATSDKFTCLPEQIEIIKSLDCGIFDMEGCAIAQVCKSNSIPLYMLKGVTDVYGSGLQSEQFLDNLSTIGKLLSDTVFEFIKNI